MSPEEAEELGLDATGLADTVAEAHSGGADVIPAIAVASSGSLNPGPGDRVTLADSEDALVEAVLHHAYREHWQLAALHGDTRFINILKVTGPVMPM